MGRRPGLLHSRKTFDIEFRKTQLKRFWALVDENEEALRAALLQDLGKPLVEATGIERGVHLPKHNSSSPFSPIPHGTCLKEVILTPRFPAVSLFKNEIVFMLEKLDEWLAPEEPYVPEHFRRLSPTIYKQPKGICLVIGAWNYPFFLTASPFLGVIASGNTGIMKPSELAPHTAMLMASLVPKYLDQTCYRVINGGEPVATELLKMQYDHIFYTGGASVGKIVMKAAAEFLTPVTLELGGKSPAIVSKKADVKLAAKRIAWGKFACAGQTCVAPDYALVEEEVHEEFLEAMKQVIQEFYEGDPKAEHKMGRIVNKTHWERVTGLIAETKGKVVCGGGSEAESLYVEPTVVSNVSLDDPLMVQEIFGPILPVISVQSLLAACELIPKISPKPLGLYIMTEDTTEMEYVQLNTTSGGMAINDTMMQIGVPNMPFGGTGPSGMGSYHGKASIDTFSHRRSVVNVPMAADEAFEWRYPNGDQVAKFKFYKDNLEAKLP
ncbi:related to Aldehyde dehydrogenase, dimeric NADP-preferring [Phialocephala subalpina]|uniref:Aldehyde dehydrogenase n=1 Tax=Phialocephala subalpina TaxID=576137 RepID=A0A1L7WJ94_9HELO|nr:related to Aldehyde dehydrogenase, dimeric NADP-preferring [Phialocephala subalpina]